MGQNAVVYASYVSVCVSFGGLGEFDWVFWLDRGDIEGGVRDVVVGHMWVVLVLGCVGGKKSLSLCICVRSVETLAVWWLVRW